MVKITKAIGYVKARLFEKGTWAGVVVAVTGGAALSEPYSWLAIAAGILAVLAPTP